MKQSEASLACLPSSREPQGRAWHPISALLRLPRGLCSTLYLREDSGTVLTLDPVLTPPTAEPWNLTIRAPSLGSRFWSMLTFLVPGEGMLLTL